MRAIQSASSSSLPTDRLKAEISRSEVDVVSPTLKLLKAHPGACSSGEAMAFYGFSAFSSGLCFERKCFDGRVAVQQVDQKTNVRSHIQNYAGRGLASLRHRRVPY